MRIECGVHIFTEICEKLHEIARFLTRLTCRTCPAGRAMPHIYEGYRCIAVPNMKCV